MAVCKNPCSISICAHTLCAPCAFRSPGSAPYPCARLRFLDLVRGWRLVTLCATLCVPCACLCATLCATLPWHKVPEPCARPCPRTSLLTLVRLPAADGTDCTRRASMQTAICIYIYIWRFAKIEVPKVHQFKPFATLCAFLARAPLVNFVRDQLTVAQG